MKRRFRLRRSADFKRVRRLGKSFAHPLIVLIKLRNECENSRFAVAAGRSVGNAVRRNRAKRLLRAAIQTRAELIKPGWDILLISRQPLAESTLRDTQLALDNLLRRAGLIQNTDDN